METPMGGLFSRKRHYNDDIILADCDFNSLTDWQSAMSAYLPRDNEIKCHNENSFNRIFSLISSPFVQVCEEWATGNKKVCFILYLVYFAKWHVCTCVCSTGKLVERARIIMWMKYFFRKNECNQAGLKFMKNWCHEFYFFFVSTRTELSFDEWADFGTIR